MKKFFYYVYMSAYVLFFFIFLFALVDAVTSGLNKKTVGYMTNINVSMPTIIILALFTLISAWVVSILWISRNNNTHLKST